LSAAGVHNQAPKVDLDICQRCLDKLKLNKSPGIDNVSSEHLGHGGCTSRVHLCLLCNAMLQNCYVPEDFGYGIIIPILKDKHGDS